MLSSAYLSRNPHSGRPPETRMLASARRSREPTSLPQAQSRAAIRRRSMTLRITSLVLASFFALPFALTAQAGEMSMDIGNMHASSEAAPCSSTDTDASANTASGSIDVQAAPGNSAQWRASASSGSQRQRVDDTESGVTSSSTAPGSSANAISAQAKPRNRWQSLVPGAIK
jgi:hypothetical protein